MAALCLGSSSAWADVEITETYDFYSWTSADAKISKATGDGVTFDVTGVDEDGTKTMTLANSVTIGESSHSFGNRLALDNYSDGSSFGWRFRNTGTTYQKGLVTQGKSPNWSPYYFSICNLKTGDKVTVTYSYQANKDAQPYFVSTNAQTGGVAVTANSTKMASGTEYTITADGHLDLVVKNNNFAMHSLVIKTTGTESVSTPSLAITGVSGKGRKVTITGGTSDAGSTVTTYYTIDGTLPTTSSNSFTTASKEITIGESAVSESTITVKAYSVSSTGAESTVGSKDVTVGTNVELNAPVISLSTFTKDGSVYHPTYTFSSDQSGLEGGAPASVTYSYSFNSGADTEAASYVASASGSITVTVSADGYTSSSTTQSIMGGDYFMSYSFDATSDISLADGAVAGSGGGNQSADGTNSSMYSLAQCNYELRDDITLTGFVFAWKITANTANCIYTRGGAGSIGYKLNNGEYIEFKNSSKSVIANSETTSTNFPIYSAVKYIYVFTPADYTVSKTITSAGWATYCSPYALDFTGEIANLTDVYIVDGVTSGTTLNLVSVKGQTVPANTGLLIEGTEGTCVIPVAASGTADVSANDLVGTTVEATLNATKGYVLMGTPAVGFYKNNNNFTLGANTAYLPADFAGADARDFFGFDFGGEATGINAVENAKQSMEGVYNLAGQRVAQPTRGLYIVNGRKVVVK